MKTVLLAVALLSIVGLSFSINVSTCQVIASPGSYDVTTTLSGGQIPFGPLSSWSTCILINATSNVDLNCNGNTIMVNDSFHSVGVVAQNSSNVTIRNCLFIGTAGTSRSGTEFHNAVNSVSRDNNATGTEYGFADTNGPNLGNSYINNRGDGVNGMFLSNGGINTLYANNTATGTVYNSNFCLGCPFGGPGTFIVNATITGNRALNGGGGFDIRATGTVITNNLAFNNSPSSFFSNGFELHGSNNTMSFNNASNNTGYGYQIEADGNLISDNVANGNGNVGFFVFSVDQNVLDANNATNNGDAGFFIAPYDSEGFDPVTDTNITNSIASGNGNGGLVIDRGEFILVDPSFFCNNAGDGISVSGSTGVTVFDSVACNNTGEGINVVDSVATNLTNNSAYDNAGSGITLANSNSSIVNLNLLFNNLGDGISIQAPSTDNNVTSSTAYNNSVGFFIDADQNNLSSNVAYNNSFNGFTLWGAANTLISNTAYGNGANGSFDSGFLVECCSANDNALINNTAYDNNGEAGFYQYYSTGNVYTGNTAYNNSEHGIEIEGDPATLNGNTVYGNAQNGIYLHDGDGNVLSGNTVHDNAQSGIIIEFGDGAMLSGDHLYGNNPDLTFATSVANTVSLSSVIFDNPLGTFSDYTNISLNATNDDDVLTMNWSAQPAPLPSGFASFANKHIEIVGGSLVTLDSATWHWLDTEPGASGESSFELWKYNGTGWSVQNSTSDTVSNTLSLSNLSSFSVFSILQNNQCPSTITSPGSYSLGGNAQGAPNDASEYLPGAGACIKIAASDVDFDCAGFQISNDGVGGTTFGVFINGSATNVTVRNCIIDGNYTFGAGIFQSDGNFLLNNTAAGNSNGFLLEQSDGNTLTGNRADNSAGRGFDLRSGSEFNTLGQNNATGNGQEGFVMGSGSDNNVLTDNIASFSATQGGFTFGGISGGSSNNLLSGNIARHNTGEGFSCVGVSSNNTLSGNTAFNNTLDGFFFQTCTGNSLIGNNASGNGQGGGTFQVSSDNNNFTGNVFDNNGDQGIRLVGSAGNLLAGNNASGNGLQGFVLQSSSSGNTLLGNFAADNVNGFQVTDSDNNSLIGNVAFDNTQHGFFVDPASGNNLTSNMADSNANDGFLLYGGFGPVTFNLLESNVAHDNGGRGFALDAASNNTLIGNEAYNNLDDAFFLTSSDSNTLIGNNAHDNTGGPSGYELFGSSGNVLVDNVASNDTYGFSIAFGNSNILSGNNASGNVFFGFAVALSDSNTLTDTLSHGNTLVGLLIMDANNTVVTNLHLYGNSPDLSLSGSGHFVTLSNVTFDSPGGLLSNYTTISLNDTLNSAYTIDHSDQPAPLPPNTASFAGKFVNITETTPNVSIDSITWHWTDAELFAVNEQGIRLWEFDGTWTLHPFSPNQPSNTLTATNLSNFSVFGLLQTITTSSGDEGGGGTGGNPDLSISFDPDGNVVTVTSDGDPVPGATVKVNGSIIGTTDSDGKISFPGCGGDAYISATKAGYGPASTTGTLNPCQECQTDLDCPASMQCVNSQCVPVPCSCGAVSNHQCVSYQCCSDTDCGSGQECVDHSCKDKTECTSDLQCADTQFCDIPSGASGGSCKDVPAGACGHVVSHQFVPYGYECGTEPGCPQCPSGQSCLDHECVGGDLSCPQTGLVGESKSCNATEDGGACANCDYEVTDPSGKKFTGKTDGEGNFGFPLNLEGTYQVSLFKDGHLIKTIQIKALPKTTGGEEPPPTGTTSDAGMIIFLLILLLLAILGILYWRSRGGRKK